MADDSKLKINYKLSNVYVCNQETSLKTNFIMVKNLNKLIILGTPFLNLIKPFPLTGHDIITNILGQSLEFKFIDHEFYKDLDLIKIMSVNQITNKKNQLRFIKGEI